MTPRAPRLQGRGGWEAGARTKLLSVHG